MLPMLARGNIHREGAGECAGLRGKILDPQICDITLSPRGLDVGTIGAHVIKQYLFMRGLLPAPFDELGKLVQQESNSPDSAIETKSRKTTNSAAKRTHKLLQVLAGLFTSLCELRLQSRPVTVMALLGPSSSRPREALELVFSPAVAQAESFIGGSDGRHCVVSAEAVRKACCKATRKLVPLLSSLPLPKSSGTTKLFVAISGHGAGEKFCEVHDRFISLKQCKSWTVLRVGTTSQASHLQHMQSYLQHRLQRQIKLDGEESAEVDDHSPCLAFCNATVPCLSFTSEVYA